MRIIVRLLVLSTAFYSQGVQAKSTAPPSTLHFEIAVRPESVIGQVLTAAMTSILASHGYGFKVTAFPPKRGLQELKAGRIDGSIGRIGNLRTLLDSPDLVRIDFPIAVVQVTRWCRKDFRPSQAPIRLGTRLGTLIALMITDHIETDRVQLQEISDQKSSLQMLGSARLDCLLSSDLILETDGISKQDLNAFDRFDMATLEVFPWIVKRHIDLKPKIEAGLRSYAFPELYRKNVLDQPPACDGLMNIICPDGTLFRKKIDMR